jgi:hypothetical protein
MDLWSKETVEPVARTLSSSESLLSKETACTWCGPTVTLDSRSSGHTGLRGMPSAPPWSWPVALWFKKAIGSMAAGDITLTT